MMVHTLNRKGSKHPRPIRKSLASSFAPYSPAPLLMPSPPKDLQVEAEPSTKVVVAKPKKAKKSKKHKAAPKRPKNPPMGFEIFREQQRDLDPVQTKKQLEDRWRNLSEKKQNRYTLIADDFRKHFDREMEDYEVEYSLWEEETVEQDPEPPITKIVLGVPGDSLFSKVVKLSDDALDGKQYTYWYVQCLPLVRLYVFCHCSGVIVFLTNAYSFLP
jgi:hypothetical protein